MSAHACARNPTVSKCREIGTIPSVGMRPNVGLKPTTPWRMAGSSTEPLVSVPSARGTSPQATAAADPELDPPGLQPGYEPLTVRPQRCE